MLPGGEGELPCCFCSSLGGVGGGGTEPVGGGGREEGGCYKWVLSLLGAALLFLDGEAGDGVSWGAERPVD